MKKLIFTLWLALFTLGATVYAAKPHAQNDIVCVWPDGSVTLPDYYTNTCPMGSVPMRR